MLTLILAEYMSGDIVCTAKIRGLVVTQETATDWDQAANWVRAIAGDPPEEPPRRRTRYPPAASGDTG